MPFTRRFIKDASRNASSTRAFWDLVSERTGKLEGARKTYQTMIDAGDQVGAAEYLASLDERSRILVTAGSIDAGARRLHPLIRARNAVQAINALRREMMDSRIMTADGPIEVPRIDRGAADDILADLAMAEARNALVL